MAPIGIRRDQRTPVRAVAQTSGDEILANAVVGHPTRPHQPYGQNAALLAARYAGIWQGEAGRSGQFDAPFPIQAHNAQNIRKTPRTDPRAMRDARRGAPVSDVCLRADESAIRFAFQASEHAARQARPSP